MALISVRVQLDTLPTNGKHKFDSNDIDKKGSYRSSRVSNNESRYSYNNNDNNNNNNNNNNFKSYDWN